jgi:hypothetical protein
MDNWPALTGVAALAFICDRLLTWMEERGWIYWRETTERTPPRAGDRSARPPRRLRRRLGGRIRPRA